MKHQENEVKFYIQDLPSLMKKLQTMNVVLLQSRVFESNLRFDTPERTLTRQYQVLRLRQDTHTRLTYKSPAQHGHEVSTRREIEFSVGDFDAAKLFLEALGYEVSISYEKFRTTYQLNDVHLMIDEMPFGIFLEIEGMSASAIKAAADSLGLDWSARCIDSYLGLFNRMQERLSVQIANLTFDNLRNIKIISDDLGLVPADNPSPE